MSTRDNSRRKHGDLLGPKYFNDKSSTQIVSRHSEPTDISCDTIREQHSQHQGKWGWIYLAVVQSLYRMSKSLHDSSLHLFTPGWMAPSPRRIRTCSTLQTSGTMSSLFSLVYTVCRPPTRCLRNNSNAWGRHSIVSPAIMKAATFWPR